MMINVVICKLSVCGPQLQTPLEQLLSLPCMLLSTRHNGMWALQHNPPVVTAVQLPKLLCLLETDATCHHGGLQHFKAGMSNLLKLMSS